MKNKPDLSAMSLDELNKRAKTTKVANAMLAIIIGLQFGIGIFLTVRKGFNVFTVIPMAFLPMLIVNYNQLKKIKDEIAKREK